MSCVVNCNVDEAAIHQFALGKLVLVQKVKRMIGGLSKKIMVHVGLLV